MTDIELVSIIIVLLLCCVVVVVVWQGYAPDYRILKRKLKSTGKACKKATTKKSQLTHKNAIETSLFYTESRKINFN